MEIESIHKLIVEDDIQIFVLDVSAKEMKLICDQALPRATFCR